MSEVKTNKISSLASNNDITLDPDGTGDVIVASGKVGISNTSPTQKLSIGGDASGAVTLQVTNSTAGTAFNDGMQMFINDSAGGLNLREAYPLQIYVNGSNRMQIDSNGNLLVNGTTQRNAGKVSIDYSGSSHGGIGINDTASANGSTFIGFVTGGTFRGSITNNNNTAVAYNTSSDHRLKENVADMTGAIDRVKQLAPKRFNFIADPNDTTVDGFLAHEAQAVVPEAVTGTKDEVDDDGNAVMQGIDQSKLVPLLTAALRETIAEIETLKTKVAALEAGE